MRGVLTVGDIQYVFVDTPGLHASRTRLGDFMNGMARQTLHEADAVALVVEPEPNPADAALAAELPLGRTVLVVNKIDRVKEKAQLLPRLAALSDGPAFAAIVPISARKADGIDRLLKELGAILPEQPFLHEPDTLSDQPTRFFVAEFVREQVLAKTKQEVPHGVAVVVERFDESTDVPHIELAIHVAREAHKKILIGARGQMLKSIGTAARARVEKMLGKHVHLQLWVRATPDWMDDAGKLRELGYDGRSVSERGRTRGGKDS